MNVRIAFIGGGNMASAIIGGLVGQGLAARDIAVLETNAEARARLQQTLGVQVHDQAGAWLADFGIVIWAVKPQVFREAAQPVAPHVREALHLSVAAGIPTDSICRWLGARRVVRTMPNTPALIGMGVTGLYAREEVSTKDREHVEQIAKVMGSFVWVEREDLLNAVTALSGSGPAYVFYLLEAMTEAGVGMGLSGAQAYQLGVETFRGAAELARRSDESAAVLRERVTSKGGTTHAALTRMEAESIRTRFVQALQAAEARSRELGLEFGRD